MFSRQRRFALAFGRGSADEDGARAAASAALGRLRGWLAPPSWRQVQVGIRGGEGLTLLAVEQAAAMVDGACGAEVKVIFFACFDPALPGRMEVAVCASGDA